MNGPPTRWPRAAQAVLVVLSALAVGAVTALLVLGGDDAGVAIGGGSSVPAAPSEPVVGQVVVRDQRLSSGGYNAWPGTWLDPRDGSVMGAFVQVSGPAAPACERPGVPQGCDDRGFLGARHRFIVLRSEDGTRWRRALEPEDLPRSAPHAFSAQATTALREAEGTPAGTLLRRVNGEDLTRLPGYTGPATAYLERHEPGAQRWTALPPLLDPDRYTANVSRIRRLRDGRTLVATGSFWRIPAGRRVPGRTSSPAEWLLLTSVDEGLTWRNALAVPAPARDAAPANEWDVAELPDGDLLAVMRTRDGDRPVRKQAILRRTGERLTTNTGETADGGWTMDLPVLPPASFPQVPGPQHPDLLAVDHGPAAGGVLHVADEAVHYTADRGATWREVAFPGDWTPHYYPSSVQLPGGDIVVLSHGGSDEDYVTGADKPVYADRVRLVLDRDAG